MQNNAPSYISTHAELFIFVLASLFSVLHVINCVARVCGKKPVFSRFAPLARAHLTQMALCYGVVYIKPNSTAYAVAVPVGGLLCHSLMFDQERKLCTGGVLLLLLSWAVYGFISGFTAPKEFTSWWKGPSLF